MTLAFQNFTENEVAKKAGPSLYDALAEAANTAELENKEKKIALNVESSQEQKASLRKPRVQKAIIDQNNALVDTNVNWAPSEEEDPEHSVSEPEFDAKAEGL